MKENSPATNKKKRNWISFFLVLYALISFSTLFWIQDEVNKPFILAFKYLSLPVVCISYGLYFFHFTDGESENLFVRIFRPLLVAFIIVFMSFGYINIVNAFIPPSQKVIVEGKIVDIKNHRSTRTITVLTEVGNRIRVRVTKEEYRNASWEKPFRKEMKRGCLGLLYKIGNHF